MSGPIAAVGGDTFGGMSGYRRPVAGNPTRLQNNLPAFRGTPNKPGAAIKTPQIKSSSNRPSRGTNITIPYARQTPLDHTNNLGRLSSGDVAFVSRDRPNVPGFAHARYTRLLGVDALNRFLEKPFWGEKGADGQYRHILVDPPGGFASVADAWRSVPFLSEWSCDGVVMSSEAPEVYYNSGKLDSQLYNIAIQGICPVNNGYCDQTGMGQLSRAIPSNATDHGNYTGANYHLYPLQMFDRDIGPLHELFVGLVAVRHEAPLLSALKAYAEAKATLDEFATATKGDLDALPALKKAAYDDARQQIDKIGKDLEKTYEGYRSAGWWDGTPAGAEKLTGPGRPFYSFKYVLFTSRTAMDLNVVDGGIDIFVPNGGPRVKRLKSDYDQYDSVEQRTIDFQNMVGAWRVGKVIDVKAQKMPWFPSGPSETGYRVTTNIDIEWWDWRKLRRTYTNSAGAIQIAEELKSVGTAKWYTDDKQKQDAGRVMQWPTYYDPDADDFDKVRAKVLKDPNVKSFKNQDWLKENPNVPINPDTGADDNLLRSRVVQTSEYMRARERFSVGDDSGVGGGKQVPIGVSPLSLLRTSKLQVVPKLPARGVTPDHRMARIDVAMANLHAMIAQPTEEELEEAIAFVEGPEAGATIAAIQAAPAASTTPIGAQSVAAPAKAAPKAPVATGASAMPPPPPAAAAASSSSATASSSTGGAAGSSDASGSADVPMVQASPSRGPSGRRARSATGAADVFSNIFGSSATGTDAGAPQPLNPQHRSSPSGGGGTTGRSFARRKQPRDSLDK